MTGMVQITHQSVAPKVFLGRQSGTSTIPLRFGSVLVGQWKTLLKQENWDEERQQRATLQELKGSITQAAASELLALMTEIGRRAKSDYQAEILAVVQRRANELNIDLATEHENREQTKVLWNQYFKLCKKLGRPVSVKEELKKDTLHLRAEVTNLEIAYKRLPWWQRFGITLGFLSPPKDDTPPPSL